MPELSSVSERAQDIKPEVDKNAGWVSRAVDGFIEGGKEAVAKPIETVAMVGAGLGAGSLIQAGLSAAEHSGGKFGAAARVGKVALIAAPLALSAYRVSEADDSVKEAGKMVFEMGLFMGASKVGSTVVARHFDAKALTYRPETELPKGVQVKAYGDTAIVTAPRDFYNFPVQVRLQNGKGFIANSTGETKLHAMPESIPGVGRVEYGLRQTTLHTDAGHKFERELMHGSTSMKDAAGNRFSTQDGTSFSARRPNGDHVSFNKDGSIHGMQGSYQSGTDWTFNVDGSIVGRSLPSGKYRTFISAEGEGVASTAAGTSRSISGRVRGSNHLPIQRTEHHFKYDRTNPADTARHPDITPIDAEVKAALTSAAKLLSQLGRGSAA